VTVSAAPDRPVEASLSRRFDRQRAVAAVALIVVAALLVFVFSTAGFTSADNLKAVLAASAVVGVLAVGEALVMLSGNFFSMSVGTTAAISAAVCIWSLQYGVVTSIVLTLVFGCVVSGIQGYAVGAWGANTIILTIAAGSIMQGAFVVITGGKSVRVSGGDASIDFLINPIAGIASSVYIFLAVAILTLAFVRVTRVGSGIMLLGASKPAGRAAGLPVTRTITVTFLLVGLCAGVAGLLLASSFESASLDLEGSLTFDAVGAVLVGGCYVAGGRGSIAGVVAGTLGIAALNSALLLRHYEEGIQILVKGGIVLVAVVITHLWVTRSRS
jgi:ribose/xylose/arabinose/galactoside ABC-type transport system permease subunit